MGDEAFLLAVFLLGGVLGHVGVPGAWRAWRRARVRWPPAWRARWPVPARGRGPGPDWGSARAARWCARVRWRAERQAILRQANLRQANLRQASARAAPRTRRRRALRRRLAVDLAGRFVQLGAQLLHRFFQRRLGFVQRFLHALGRGLHFALELAQLVELDLALDVGLHVVDVALRAAQQVADGAGHLGQAFGADDDQGDDADHHQFSEADIKHAMAARKEKLAGRRGRGPEGKPRGLRNWTFPWLARRWSRPRRAARWVRRVCHRRWRPSCLP